MQVVATSTYERSVKRLLSPEERNGVESALVAGWDRWPVIPGTGGARKARIPLKGRGKRGGGRVIYFVQTCASVLYLLDIYAKNAKENLTDAEKRTLRGILEALQEGSATERHG